MAWNRSALHDVLAQSASNRYFVHEVIFEKTKCSLNMNDDAKVNNMLYAASHKVSTVISGND